MANQTHNPESLGIIVANAGVPVSLASNLSADNQDLTAHWIQVQALPGNGNDVYIGYAEMVPTTGVGVLKILGAGETWSFPANAVAGNRFAVANFYLDVAANGEGVLACCYVA